MTHGKLLVALSFSGGGSRAAYFAQQVLERLHAINITVGGEQVRVLDEVDYISSVSGGSLAAAYHAAWYPSQRNDPAAYFRQFRKQMTMNIQNRVILRLFSPSWLGKLFFSDIQRTDLLADFFDKYILGRVKFGQLRRHAEAGLAPTVLLNSIIYTSERFGHGSKFVFTTLKSSDFHMPKPQGQADRDLVRAIGVVTLDDLGHDPDKYTVARGVTASAAFPILIRPLRIKDRKARRKKRILLGDGGIYDNLGVESVTQRLVRVLKTEPYPGALLIVVNAERPYEFAEGLRLLSVLHALAESRARALSRVVLRYLSGQAPANRPIKVVELAFMRGARNDAEAKKLAKVPTAFKIKRVHQKMVERSVEKLFGDHGVKLAGLAGAFGRAFGRAAAQPAAAPRPRPAPRPDDSTIRPVKKPPPHAQPATPPARPAPRPAPRPGESTVSPF
jgi:hypothetical protein